jgi:hypothetical protein
MVNQFIILVRLSMPRKDKGAGAGAVKGKAKSKAKSKIINPFTGRKITVGGVVYKRLNLLSRGHQFGGAKEKAADSVRLFDTGVLKQQSEKFFDKLVNKSSPKPIPTKLAASTEEEPTIIPKNKYSLVGSNLPPAPQQTHSYYHHHAPFAQDFGSYVCLKKDTLRDLGMFLRDSMFSSVK